MRSDVLEMQALIRGDVQGVGFRAAAKIHADRLKLTGFVRNLPDGAVELCAQGEKQILDQFIRQLQAQFRVQMVECSFYPVQQIYSDFKINH